MFLVDSETQLTFDIDSSDSRRVVPVVNGLVIRRAVTVVINVTLGEQWKKSH